MFLLHTENVFDYLIQQNLLDADRTVQQVEPLKNCKNFNLLVTESNGRRLLVKQECKHELTHNQGWSEWQVYELFRTFPELNDVCPLVSDAIHFDKAASIIVFEYREDYSDLKKTYEDEALNFPPIIAGSIGVILAQIHRATLDCKQYRDFLRPFGQEPTVEIIPDFLSRLRPIEPEVFSTICPDGIEFLRLYQRHSALEAAMYEMNKVFESCCLIHNDLRLHNILLHSEWMSYSEDFPGKESLVKIIDWENSLWGDPTCDLGEVIASYLEIWLDSLMVSKAIALETAMRLATVPLECLQPSINAFIKGYLSTFPEILERYPNFFQRITQFAGVNLIQKILNRVEQHIPFDNKGICTLQVAKSLLCSPAQSISAVFGVSTEELLRV
jgi:5-methylthioribose kinase